ncbi:MAG TPA: lipocalin family protein [Fontimonas sp.]
MTARSKSLIAVLGALLSGCAGVPAGLQEIRTVPHVDIERYMGTWYPILNIPPSIEKDAYNSMEQYSLDDDGNIPTRFTYHKGSANGELKTLDSKAYIVDRQSNAQWGVKFFWFQPVKSEYLIAWLADDYSEVIVARNKRDYVWYMARTPNVSAEQIAAAIRKIEALGYDLSKLNRVRADGGGP